MIQFAAMLLGAYLVGGIPFGYLVARFYGVDIRAQGSGNIGATNVGRVLGFRFGLLVFVLDFAKGALPVAGAMFLQRYHPIEASGVLRDDWLRHGLIEVGAGLLAFLGHLLPVYLGFRGGKGVATGAGAVTLLVPVPALAALGTWVLLVSAIRYISLASVVAAIVLCVVQLARTSFAGNDPRTWFCVLAAGMVLVRHRANLVRLLHGTENRLPPSAMLDRLARSLHVLAVGLWFGGSVFFSLVVTLLIFNNLENLPDDRPDWLPLPAEYARIDDHIDGPKEQGTRLAGRVVGAVFPSYFLMQILCGVVALIPALTWWRTCVTDRANRWRCYLLLAGLTLALAGAWLEQKVHDLQGRRHTAVESYLKSQTPTEATIKDMQAARKWFGMWHGISVLVNYAAILAVVGAMFLTVSLPSTSGPADPALSPSGASSVDSGVVH
jgi:acyl phosphate:glycerol-3-phosphate acyltransferase